MTFIHRTNFGRFFLSSTVVAATLAALVVTAPAPAPAAAAARITAEISVRGAPPDLPTYGQPPIPGPGYLWTPGYWLWNEAMGYYWVPGTWIQPPSAGLLWTPPYWGWNAGAYQFHQGYWGPQVGFYGDVNYGFGYAGTGYQGGHWENGAFRYNRRVNNFGLITIAGAYDGRIAISNRTHLSYAGGEGGLKRAPSAVEYRAEGDRHFPVTGEQQRHVAAAAAVPALAASRANGYPAIAATSYAGQFDGEGVVRLKN